MASRKFKDDWKPTPLRVTTDTVVKQVWRQPLDEQRDLVLVISSSGYVRTVWVNLRSDKHATLDSAKYGNRKTWMARERIQRT